MFRFGIKEKVAVVAGAAGDIGRAIVQELLKEGCYLVATGTRMEKLEKTFSGMQDAFNPEKLRLVQMCIESPEDIDRAIDQVDAWFGRIDILINSAGILCRKSFFETEHADMETSYNVNLIGAFDLAKKTAAVMKRANAGTIILIGSQNGFTAIENRIAYASTKAALTMMTKSMALELAPYGITVNMVAPGIVDSSMALERLNSLEIRKRYEDSIPLKRLVSPLDCANCVLFMASPLASAVTGTSLLVDCGLLLRQSLPR